MQFIGATQSMEENEFYLYIPTTYEGMTQMYHLNGILGIWEKW